MKTKMVMAVAVQEGWPLYHFEVAQAFVRARIDTNEYMKLAEKCDTFARNTGRLGRPIHEVRQAGRP